MPDMMTLRAYFDGAERLTMIRQANCSMASRPIEIRCKNIGTVIENDHYANNLPNHQLTHFVSIHKAH